MSARSAGVRRGRHGELKAGAIARLDVGRVARTGVPEVILAEGKTVDHLFEILEALRAVGRGALVSRPSSAQVDALRSAERARRLPVRFRAGDRVVQLAGPLGDGVARGVAAVVTAGTSDVPVAEEAGAILDAYGVRTLRAYDIGVAGLHRLQRAVRRLERHRPRVYLAFAGREGALPTVLAGLVRAPVVGIPTSVGYGRGGRGEAALNAMLQSCAPIAVVNIDAAVPAALFALHVLAGAARARRGAR